MGSEEGQVVYFTRFVPSLDRGGGSRRFLQVMELLSGFGAKTVSSARNDWLEKEIGTAFRPGTVKNWQKVWQTGGQYLMWREGRRENYWRLHYKSRLWKSALNRKGVFSLALLDDPIYFEPLVRELFRRQVPVVAVNHNIETLVPSNSKPRYRRFLFRREAACLRRCSLVLAISREESSHLSQLSVPTVFLPYYPVKELEERFLAIRQRRESSVKADYLLLGSAVNAETRRGMERMIALWQRRGAASLGGRLLVAGYKTDLHFGGLGQEGPAVFLGPLTHEELDKRLASVRAIICYQDRGGGALTRICEMLLAGVPVLANDYAARSYDDLHGLLRFGDLEDLDQAIGRLPEVLAPAHPLRPQMPEALLRILETAGS